MASGAGRLLDEAGHFDRVEDALKDAHFVLATTARPRGLTKPVLSPEEAVRQAAERISRGENVSIMFGPERSGLENEDIAQANAIVSVPVNPISILNLRNVFCWGMNGVAPQKIFRQKPWKWPKPNGPKQVKLKNCPNILKQPWIRRFLFP